MILRSEPASYRDFRARIVYADNDVYRLVLAEGAAGYRQVRPILDQLVSAGLLLPCDEVEGAPFAALGAVHAIRHPHIPFISYPYEWSFEMLKAAALLHLDLHLRALALGATLTDGSAYNIQFIGTRPVFIDCTSIVPYVANTYWEGYGQFCDQFLGPLLLASHGRVPFQRWYRGAPEGLHPEWIERALPIASRLRPGVALNIGLNARGRREPHAVQTRHQRPLPLAGLRWLIENMRRLIDGLRQPPPAVARVVEYGHNSPHTVQYQEAKRLAVARFIAELKPQTLLDLGCNTGTHSRLAAGCGAARVVGIDRDPWAIDEAFRLARVDDQDILPLVCDLLDPSPAQGWRGQERKSLTERFEGQAILALALIHHLCLTRGLPIAEAVECLVALGPFGLIEFVPADDPWAQTLSGVPQARRKEYSTSRFEEELCKHATVVSVEILAGSGRRLYRYSRA